MRPITLTFAATGATFTTDPVVLDIYTNPQSVSIIANVGSGGSGNLAIQVSNDDPFATNFSPATATWLGLAASAFSNGGAVSAGTPVEAVLTSIPRLIRFTAAGCVGNPVVSFKIVQGGLTGV